MLIKNMLAALAGVVALACASQASATVTFEVDFTAAGPWTLYGNGNPYDVGSNPTITGSFTGDSRLFYTATPDHGFEALTGLNFTVGDKTYGLGDINTAVSFINYSNGAPISFLFDFTDGTGFAQSLPLMSIVEGSNIIACDTCVHYTTTVTPTGTPEPATWAMMLAGFFGLGAALRTQRRLRTA